MIEAIRMADGKKYGEREKVATLHYAQFLKDHNKKVYYKTRRELSDLKRDYERAMEKRKTVLENPLPYRRRGSFIFYFNQPLELLRQRDAWIKMASERYRITNEFITELLRPYAQGAPAPPTVRRQSAFIGAEAGGGLGFGFVPTYSGKKYKNKKIMMQ